MLIQESAEMYLETILVLSRRNPYVRSVDIAREMGFSKPTVSETMKKFREKGYIKTDLDGHITLTESGMNIASQIYERHEVLAHILMQLGVEEQIAYADACKMEHDLSQQTFAAMKAHFLGHGGKL